MKITQEVQFEFHAWFNVAYKMYANARRTETHRVEPRDYHHNYAVLPLTVPTAPFNCPSSTRRLCRLSLGYSAIRDGGRSHA